LGMSLASASRSRAGSQACEELVLVLALVLALTKAASLRNKATTASSCMA
jgi:hypothetical protein